MLRIMRPGLAGLVFALPLASASATVSPQERTSERRVWPTIVEGAPIAGQIEYAFDTALNRTTARYRTSLAGGNVVVRILSGPPAVHTLLARYEFAGRAPGRPPDTVRVSLMSDEVRQSASPYRPLLGAEPILVINIGDTMARYPLGIAQKIEEWSAPNVTQQVVRTTPGTESVNNAANAAAELRIERTATAWIPICDFLALVRGKNVSGTVAGLDFELNEGVISGLRQFAADMAPGSVAPSSQIACK